MVHQTPVVIFFFLWSFFLNFYFYLFYFTILYWFCHTLTWIHLLSSCTICSETILRGKTQEGQPIALSSSSQFPFSPGEDMSAENWGEESAKPAPGRLKYRIAFFIASQCPVVSASLHPWYSDGKESACSVETQVQSLGWEDPLEKGKVTHSSILAWEIPWTEDPGGLQSMGSQRVKHD